MDLRVLENLHNIEVAWELCDLREDLMREHPFCSWKSWFEFQVYITQQDLAGDAILGMIGLFGLAKSSFVLISTRSPTLRLTTYPCLKMAV